MGDDHVQVGTLKNDTTRQTCSYATVHEVQEKGKLESYAMKRVAVVANLPTPWLFQPVKRLDERADYCQTTVHEVQEKGKLESYSMKRVAAVAHLPTTWRFQPVKRIDDGADYNLDCSFFKSANTKHSFFTFEWTEVHTVGEQWWSLGFLNIPSEFGYLAMPINFHAWGKIKLVRPRFEPGTSGPRVKRSSVTPHWLETKPPKLSVS